MERILIESRKCCPAATLLNFFQNCRKTTYLFLSALFLLLALSSPASAVVDSFVATSSDGSYHQYNYGELLDSYALKLLGIPNGLYEDFAAKKSVALLDTDCLSSPGLLDTEIRVYKHLRRCSKHWQ